MSNPLTSSFAYPPPGQQTTFLDSPVKTIQYVVGAPQLPTATYIDNRDYVPSSGLIHSKVIPQATVTSKPTDEPHEQKASNNLRKNISVMLLPLICAIIFLVSGYKAGVIELGQTEIVAGAHRVLGRVFANLEQDPILHLATSDATAHTCPESHEIIPVGTWQGISRGCLCPNGVIKEYHECFYNSDCQPVKQRSEEELQVWKNKVNFCAQRVGDVWTRSTTCANDQTQCASDFCMPGINDCPINRESCTVQGAAAPPTPPKHARIKKSQQKFVFAHDVTPISTFKTDATVTCTAIFDPSTKGIGRPLVGLEISNSKDTLCLDPYTSVALDASANTKDYPLSNQKSVGCGPYGAFSSKITPTRPTNTLVTYLESNVVAKDLYDLNDLQSRLEAVNQFDQYDKETYQIYLLAVSAIPITGESKECEDFDKEDFKSASNWGYWSRRIVRFFAWTLFSLAILVIFLSLVFVSSLISHKIASEERTRVKLAKWYVVSSFVLSGVAIIAGVFFYILNFVKLQHVNNALLHYQKSGCIPEPEGINLAIANSALHHEETVQIFGYWNHWWFWTGLVHLFLWVIIWKLWKQKLSANPTHTASN